MCQVEQEGTNGQSQKHGDPGWRSRPGAEYAYNQGKQKLRPGARSRFDGHLWQQLQELLSYLISVEDFDSGYPIVGDIDNYQALIRVKRNSFFSRSPQSYWVRNRVDRSAEIVSAATPVNDRKRWNLLSQFCLADVHEKGR